MTQDTLPRGIRNNNPLNIIHSPANHWQGLSTPPSDGHFCRFTSPFYGYRAAFKLLYRYWHDYRRRTIRGICYKWAPAGDGNNQPELYAKAVAKNAKFSITRNLPAPEDDRDLWVRIVLAMTLVENGAKFHEKLWTIYAGDAWDALFKD
jgi:hypothetical protein